MTRAFDDAGRLVTITDWLHNATAYHYDPNSNNDSITYANGTLGTIGFDHADRLMSINDTKGGTSFLQQTYSRDANSLLTGDGTSSFGYDPLNRVTSSATSAYTYDAADHLTQIAVSGGNTTTLSYDIADQVQSLSVMNGQTQVSSQRYSYDPNGNRTRAVDQTNTNTTFGYDQANRLVNFNGAYTYGYDGNGLRQSKTTSGSTEAFAWDSSGSLPLVIKDGINSFVNGPDGLPLEQVTGGGAVHTYYHDQLGSTRVVADGTGTVENTYAFDAYGNVSASTGSVANALRLAGQFMDAESSMYYMRARFYDPRTAQFVSRDPVAASTRRPYTYASDNPLNLADPTGRMTMMHPEVGYYSNPGDAWANIPRDPDYRSVRASVGESTWGVTCTRGGAFYFETGVAAGVPRLGVQVVDGYIGGDPYAPAPSEQAIDDFVQADTFSVGGGVGAVYNEVWGNVGQTGQGDFSSERGIGTPYIGGGYSYGWGPF